MIYILELCYNISILFIIKFQDKIQSLVTQRAEEEPFQAIDENEIFYEVMGRERHGCIRGYGFRPTHSSVLGKIPSCYELITELEQMRQHNNGLKNEMQHLKEKMKHYRQNWTKSKKGNQFLKLLWKMLGKKD